MRILGLIPARGRSRSVPRKNIKLLAGKPVIANTIEEARESRFITRLIVSTDDEDIARVSRKYGAEVPFMRPKELAEDDTLDLPVFQHALKWLEENEGYTPDIIVHLRPTSPFRKARHIDAGVKLLMKDKEADSVRSVCEPGQTPYKMWKIEDGYLVPLLTLKGKGMEPYNMPRQKLPTVYWQTASVDVTRYNTIMGKNSMTGERILPLIVDEEYSIDLDSEIDFRIAEEIMKLEETK